MGELIEDLAAFRDRLSGNERTVRVRDLDVVDKAVAWLLDCRHELGYWGVKDVAETSLCCIAIARWAGPRDVQELGTTGEWLLGEAVAGAWDTPWDSGVAVQALLAIGFGDDPRAQQALERLCALDPEHTARTVGPHHAAQVLNALHASRAGFEQLNAWTASLLEFAHLRKEIYVLSQVVSASLVSGTATPADLRDCIQELGEYLQQQRQPSEGEMRSFAPAVEALSHAGLEWSGLVGEKSATLIRSWSDKRAWYKSPRHVAVALIALHGAESASEIVIDKPGFNEAFEDAFRVLPAQLARENAYSALLGATLAALVGLTLLVVVVWGHSDALLVNGVAVTLLTVLISATVRELYKKLRRRSIAS